MPTERDSLDQKNISLAQQLVRLRNNIDIDRVIGLNVEELKENPGYGTFLGHIQQQAHECIAIGFCKIFENPNRHELDSIPSIVALASKTRIDDASVHSIVEFGVKHGNVSDIESPRTHVQATLDVFKQTHAELLKELRTFRNKQGAHSESGTRIASLPSHHKFEVLWTFSYDLYKLVSDHFVNVGPAQIEHQVGEQLLNLVARIGVQSPYWDFPDGDVLPPTIKS